MDLGGEQLRHRYLEAIGVSSWLPRARLPGAAPSADWVERFRYPWVPGADSAVDSTGSDAGSDDSAVDNSFEDRSGESSSRAVEPAMASAQAFGTAADARAQARASLAPLTATDSSVKAPRTEVQPAPATRSEAVEPARRGVVTPPPRVKLAFVLAGDLLVVDSLPPASRQGFSAQHRRLLTGLAQSMGVTDRPSDASLLSWPVLAGPTLDQGPEELTKAVRRKLELTLALSSVRRALLLGESAAQWLLEREESLDALRGIRFSLRPELHCIASVSLSQALQLPELKAELWRDLQPLLKS